MYHVTVTVTVTRATRRRGYVGTVGTTRRVISVKSVRMVTMVIPLTDRAARFVPVLYLLLGTLSELAIMIH